ncbi:winged helix-turn-helix transcriptional regulator [Enterococcus mediterraneensis]|uniref:winged helix-turn-helix transcriptional regulator n=1 Tax=Enterococcus mediterraneensis TaxID=2364791 RepID=UPI000F06E1DD|nr:helix-turn-helix domain-containing protein [Enterococcus mediterraneensis]
MEQIKVTEFSLCPKFEKAFTILGKKWNGLILDVLLEGGPQRFVELANNVPEVSDRVLVERLRELEREGIVTKESNLYRLTEKGTDLEKSLISVKNWSEKWITPEECS